MELTTKTQLMEQALAKYTQEEIERAVECTFHAKKRNGGKIICSFSLASRSPKPKAERIKTEIRSTLKNDRGGPTLNDRMYLGDTSSTNISNIEIYLKFK